MRRLLVAAFLLGFVLPAAAAGWCAYVGAFPRLPCSDGWAACRVDGAAVGGGTSRDAAGRPVAADARIGWFDLEPGPAFSPFVGLSSYAGAPSAAMATMLSPAVGAPGVAAPVVDPAVPNPGGAMPGFPSPAGGTPALPGPATPGPREVGLSPGVATAVPVSGSPTSGSPTSGLPTSGSPTPVSVLTPVMAPPPGTPAVINTVAAPVAGCTDLVSLEPQAMVGGLSGATVSCLEARVDNDSVQTTRDKVSRILILNAEGKGNRADWERLVKRHLEDIDRSDPDLCFRYALQLSREGSGRSLGVIRWADTALENKHRWEGATYKKRVFDLYRLRAEAANKLWQAAEKEYTTGEHTAENEAKSEKYRGMAKDHAREWLDYAAASQQDTKNALALCVSASGNRSFCEGG